MAEEVRRIESTQEPDPKQLIQQISIERKAAVPNQAKPPVLDLRTKIHPQSGVVARMKGKTSTLQVWPKVILSEACSYMRLFLRPLI